MQLDPEIESGCKVLIDQATLQPGSWGVYKDTRSRRDIVQSMLELGEAGAGQTVLRLGGSMCNAEGYIACWPLLLALLLSASLCITTNCVLHSCITTQAHT